MMSNCEEYRKRMPYQLLLKTQFSIAFSDFEAFWEWKQKFSVKSAKVKQKILKMVFKVNLCLLDNSVQIPQI